MTQLRPLSPRPELVVGSPDAARIEAPDKSQVGVVGTPLGRARVLTALPLSDVGPQQLDRAETLHVLVSDRAGNVIGLRNAVWIHRLLYARPVEDTRRLAV